MQLFYTVLPKDTLDQIARRWQLPVESLIAANHLEMPYTIYVRQQLSVPPGVRGENDLTRAISHCFATPIAWSPDGRKIAYLSSCNHQGTAHEMWMINVFHPVPVRLIKGASITSFQCSPAPSVPLKKTYASTVFKVQFHYPSPWERVTRERYEGPDGFFQLSAIFSDERINGVCHNEAFHQLSPYGSEPRLIKTKIQQQEACFIFPSADQPPEMKSQAALIVRYPKPIRIEGTTYNYFILWADQHHLNKISSTLVFLESEDKAANDK